MLFMLVWFIPVMEEEFKDILLSFVRLFPLWFTFIFKSFKLLLILSVIILYLEAIETKS